MFKFAGGPGSGVKSSNTLPIDMPLSDYVTIGQRKKFMESHSSDMSSVPLKLIKKVGQANYVPKKVSSMMDNAEEVLSKPIDVLKVWEKEYHVLDGHHRFLVAQKLGKKTIKANVYQLPKELDKATKKRAAVIALVKGDKILMGKRKDSGKLTNPGGHLDKGEDPKAGVIREVAEETGLKVTENQVKPITRTKDGNMTIYGFKAEIMGKVRPTSKNDPDEEVGRWKWLPKDELKDKTVQKQLAVEPKKNIIIDKFKQIFEEGIKDKEERMDKTAYNKIDVDALVQSRDRKSAMIRKNKAKIEGTNWGAKGAGWGAKRGAGAGTFAGALIHGTKLFNKKTRGKAIAKILGYGAAGTAGGGFVGQRAGVHKGKKLKMLSAVSNRWDKMSPQEKREMAKGTLRNRQYASDVRKDLMKKADFVEKVAAKKVTKAMINKEIKETDAHAKRIVQVLEVKLREHPYKTKGALVAGIPSMLMGGLAAGAAGYKSGKHLMTGLLGSLAAGALGGGLGALSGMGEQERDRALLNSAKRWLSMSKKAKEKAVKEWLEENMWKTAGLIPTSSGEAEGKIKKIFGLSGQQMNKIKQDRVKLLKKEIKMHKTAEEKPVEEIVDEPTKNDSLEADLPLNKTASVESTIKNQFKQSNGRY